MTGEWNQHTMIPFYVPGGGSVTYWQMSQRKSFALSGEEVSQIKKKCRDCIHSCTVVLSWPHVTVSKRLVAATWLLHQTVTASEHGQSKISTINEQKDKKPQKCLIKRFLNRYCDLRNKWKSFWRSSSCELVQISCWKPLKIPIHFASCSIGCKANLWCACIHAYMHTRMHRYICTYMHAV